MRSYQCLISCTHHYAYEISGLFRIREQEGVKLYNDTDELTGHHKRDNTDHVSTQYSVFVTL